MQTLRCAWRGGQGPDARRVHRGHPCDVVEVDKVDQVAELHAVDDLDVLVLVVEVLPWLGEPGRRVAERLE